MLKIQVQVKSSFGWNDFL